MEIPGNIEKKMRNMATSMSINLAQKMTKVAAALFALISTMSVAHAFTNVQTSTSLGLYRDYRQTYHYPIYHSWSINGIYANGFETSIEFYLNNDFTLNEWSFYPTQAVVGVPLPESFQASRDVRSEVKLGRQFFSEGFDLNILDGMKSSLYWSNSGGVMPVMGYLRSTDFAQPGDNYSPLIGLYLWESIYKLQLRGGYTARDQDFVNRYAYVSGQYQFSDLIWQPTIYSKGEYLADKMTFNQSTSELALHFLDNLDGRLAYSNLAPRPTNKIEYSSYVYRLFSISPTETVVGDLTWAATDRITFAAGTEKGFYNSGYRDETSDRHDLSMDFQFAPGRWLAPSLTYVKSYGGEIHDVSLRYISDISSQSRITAELDNAYVKKINQIQGWAQHVRGSYETHFWNRAKALFALEAERNQYYVFDVRTMAYVTNYL